MRALYGCSGHSFHSYEMDIILLFYRWENRGSEKLTDMAKFSPPREESGFEHGPS